jgi:hypothetical protein
MRARTLGPFTGRQLTTIICVLVVTVLFPISAWAAGSKVFIGDPHNSNIANVDGAGSLQTKVSSGTFRLDGVAPGNIAQTNKFVQSRNTGLSNGYQAVLTPPAGRQLIVTGVHLSWYGVDPAQVTNAFMTIGNANTCLGATGTYSAYFTLESPRDFRDPKFSPGFIVPAGKSLCVAKTGFQTPQVLYSAYGYTVPAGSVALP